MRGLDLGLGFTNPVGTGGVLDVCLCLGCGGVGGEWVGCFLTILVVNPGSPGLEIQSSYRLDMSVP